MIKINKVISGNSVAGDGTTLQPAAPLSEEVKAQLFDEFKATEPTPAQPVASQTIFFALVLAALLAGVALFVIKQIKTDELKKDSH
jgi:hypothetical protein